MMRGRARVLLILLFAGFLLLPALQSHAQEAEQAPVAAEAPASSEATMSATATGDESGGGPGGSTAPSVITNQPFTGAASYTVPIAVPPGRGKIAPNLALAYSSYQANGWIGLGWSLQAGAIQRSTKKGLNYAANDYVFTVSGSALELVPRGDWGANHYGSKTEGGFTRFYYNSQTGGWEATTKDGTKYYYGTTADSRQENARGVFSYQLDRVQDTNGNYMTFTYWKDQGEIYLSQIDYTGNGSLSPSNSVKFNREARTDVYSSFVSGSEAKTAYRLKNIEVSAGGQLARRYELTYDYSPSTGRSLLRSVKQYGSDGVTGLPETFLSYQEKDNTFQTERTWGVRVPGREIPGVNGLVQMADVNGDGKTDFIYNKADGLGESIEHHAMVMLSTGSGLQPAASWSTRPINSFFRMADVNGDGRADLVYDSLFQDIRVMVSTGSGFQDEQWGMRMMGYNLDIGRFQVADVNGDGKADLVYEGYNEPTYEYFMRVLVSTGSGFQTDTVWGRREQSHGISYQMADVNSDGKADLIYGHTDGSARVMLSTGTGFQAETLWGWGVGGYADYSGGFQMADVNGDGLADLVYDHSGGIIKVLLNTGNGFRPAASWGSRAGSYYQYGGGFRMADVNGDGLADFVYDCSDGIVRVMLSTGHGFQAAKNWGARGINSFGGLWPVDMNGDGLTDISYTGTDNTIRVLQGKGPVPDLLSTVRNPLGGTTTVTYAPSSAYENTYLPFILQTVAETAVDDGNGVVSTLRYGYAGGFYDAGDREFRGFEVVAAADPEGTTTETVFHQDDTFRGLPYDTTTKDSSGNIYTRTCNTYEAATPYTGVKFPRLKQKDDYLYDGADTYKQGRAAFTYDAYGNIKTVIHYGDVAIEGDEKTEGTNYINDLTNWIFLPSTTYIKDSAGTIKAQAWFTYDTQGNLFTKKAWNDTGADPIVTYTYNAYGNQETIKDPKGNITTITYDTTQTYPVQVENALGHISRKIYDPRYGKPHSETDPNDNTTTYDYDAFGRVSKVTNPYDTTSTYGTVTYIYTDNGIPGQQKVRSYATEQSGTSQAIWKETYLDGLGREIKTRSEGAGGKVIITVKKYNQRGQLDRQTLPYFSGIDQPRWITYEYDPIGRISRVTSPDGTSSTKGYLQGRTILIDPNGHAKIEEKDVYGRLIAVEEYTGTHPDITLYASTTYQYDTLGNLIHVTDAKGNETIITYDSLSRKTTMQDPDMGYWVYTYDLNGNLATQTDAKGQIIRFSYDALNRIKKKDYPTGTDILYTYDEPTSTNAIGRLTTVTEQSGSTKYWYDMVGRTVRTEKGIDALIYTTETTYDALGRTESITYPDNETVTYSYDRGGNLFQVPGYVTYSDYNALGQPATVTFANGVTTTYQYDDTNKRLSHITTGSLQDLSYGYDSKGNITTITDALDANRTQTFAYDALNRLTLAESVAYGGVGKITYRYDEIGNITYNSKVGNYTYGPQPHAVIQAGSRSYTYDLNGNMTSNNGKTIQYDYDNRATSIAYGTSTVDNTYDYTGQRVKKVTATATIVYIGKLYEGSFKNAAWAYTKYIFAGSQRIASRTSSTTYYYHTEHLGSTGIVTDQTGAMVQEIYYYPFGKVRANSGNATRYKYTGQEEDAETGLYYYNARYYDPVIGRFISADTIVPNPADPQHLNRYSYCGNNPLNYIDPTGHLKIGKFFSRLFGGLFKFIQRNWRAIVSVVITAAAFYAAGGVIAALGESEALQACIEVSSLTQAGVHAAAGAVAGGLSSAINRGNIELGMVTGGLSAGIANYAGSFIKDLGWGYQFAGRTAVGGATGGITSSIYGGNFWKGFIRGSETAAAGYIFNHMLHITGRGLIYHRHGNTPPNWGIEGEEGVVTREIPPDGSSIAFEQSMKTVAAYYVEALSVGLGALVTYATGNVEWGALTYESLSNFFKITTGAPAGLPKVPVEPFINPPGAE